jgi:uracil-DNA glycosylase
LRNHARIWPDCCTLARMPQLKFDGDDEEQASGAEPFVPDAASLPELSSAAQECRGCDLYKDATQTVFGAGPGGAPIMLVGEQPGDQEDRQGSPFVGPAGRTLDEALVEAGITRDKVYVTNAVKHFKFEPHGKKRIHKKPGAYEINACLPWLEAEFKAVRPAIVVCLGATAARAILGPKFKLMQQRGHLLGTDHAFKVVATIHPSAVLRSPDPEARQKAVQMLVDDLTVAARALAELNAR